MQALARPGYVQFGLIQDGTGVEHDAFNRTRHVGSGTGDFRAPRFTAKESGIVQPQGGEVIIDLRSGEVPVAKIVTGG